MILREQDAAFLSIMGAHPEKFTVVSKEDPAFRHSIFPGDEGKKCVLTEDSENHFSGKSFFPKSWVPSELKIMKDPIEFSEDKKMVIRANLYKTPHKRDLESGRTPMNVMHDGEPKIKEILKWVVDVGFTHLYNIGEHRQDFGFGYLVNEIYFYFRGARIAKEE